MNEDRDYHLVILFSRISQGIVSTLPYLSPLPFQGRQLLESTKEPYSLIEYCFDIFSIISSLNILFRFYFSYWRKGELKYYLAGVFPSFLLAICIYPSYFVHKSECYPFETLTSSKPPLYFYCKHLKSIQLLQVYAFP